MHAAPMRKEIVTVLPKRDTTDPKCQSNKRISNFNKNSINLVVAYAFIMSETKNLNINAITVSNFSLYIRKVHDDS